MGAGIEAALNLRPPPNVVVVYMMAVMYRLYPPQQGGIMIGNVIQARYLQVTDYPTASALSFILMLAILVGLFIYARLIGTEELVGASI